MTIPQRDENHGDDSAGGSDWPGRGSPTRADGRSWCDSVRQRCFVLWSGVGSRSAGRTRWFYREEVPDEAPVPGASTIRRWAAEERWNDWAGENVPPLRGQDVYRWQKMWFRQMMRQMDAALRAERNLLLGTFDGDPVGGLKALTKANGTMEHLLAHPGVRALLRASFSQETPGVFFNKRERQAFERLRQRHGGRQYY